MHYILLIFKKFVGNFMEISSINNGNENRIYTLGEWKGGGGYTLHALRQENVGLRGSLIRLVNAIFLKAHMDCNCNLQS